jgi:hypothetical protein
MSLLQPNPQATDDAALGEELTKGSTHLIWAGAIAAVLVSAAIAIYVIAGQKPPAATGSIDQVWIHPQHSETSGFDANGAPMPKEVYNQIYVFGHARIHNESKLPLFLHRITTNTTVADGPHTSYAAMGADYDRIFVAYPAMPVPHGPALSPDTTIASGQTVEGTFVCAFKLTKEQWDAHNDLDFNFSFQYQPDLKLTPQAAIIIDR